MFVAAKDRTSMFNTGMVGYIYIGEDRKTVKAVAGPRETVYRLGIYRSESEAAAAFRILAGEMEKGRDIVYMPTDEEVEMFMRRENARPERFFTRWKKAGSPGWVIKRGSSKT